MGTHKQNWSLVKRGQLSKMVMIGLSVITNGTWVSSYYLVSAHVSPR